MNDVEVVKELYRDLCTASIKKDLDLLDRLLSDDYELVHMTGMHQTKSEYMNSVKTGRLTYYESIHESIEAEIVGDKANVIGKTKTLASPFGASKSWWRLRQDLVMKKIDDQWVIVHSIASTY
ncbi:MAG: nuclear transport factor 2 family protein [Bacilli bacterium]|nr:nuclear transport factor 2 family protein [Bacilli bacterium]